MEKSVIEVYVLPKRRLQISPPMMGLREAGKKQDFRKSIHAFHCIFLFSYFFNFQMHSSRKMQDTTNIFAEPSPLFLPEVKTEVKF